MPNFHQYIARHGEFGVQAIIEQIERTEGITARHHVSLEDRWGALMQEPQAPQQQSNVA